MQQNDVATLSRSGRLDPTAVGEGIAAQQSLRRMQAVVTARADRWVAHPTVVTDGESVDWWHVCWERLGDVAFAQALDPDRSRGAWLRAETMRICDLPTDDWIGPFFRARYEPLIGMLETAHVGLGVMTVLELCPELFSDGDKDSVLRAVREKCLIPCERGLWSHESGFDVITTSGTETVKDYLQNHYWVLLDAFGAAALMLDDDDRIATLPDRFNCAQALHNSDSYGETVQYWGYAAIHLTNLWELVDNYRPRMINKLDRPDLAMMPWLAHSVMFTGQAREWGPGAYSAMVNFGDSAFTARPPSDALSSIARHAQESDPQNAGLARWLIEHTYADLELAPADLSSFGFFNQIGWRTLANLTAAAAPISPTEAGLPLAAGFETGMVAVRDRWSEPTGALAAQTGHPELNVDSHRHDDYGSFVLGFGGEVIFTDPGHCCYRLQSYQDALAAEAHSTWTISDPTGQHLPRRRRPEGTVGRRFGPKPADDAFVFGVDLADLYDDRISRARRTWVSMLPHVVLIIDEVVAEEPVIVDSRFVINNRDNKLQVGERGNGGLALRRSAVAAGLERLHATADESTVDNAPRRSWCAAHDIYQPQPNAPTQGKEGGGVVYTFGSGRPAKTVESIYAVVMAAETEIDGWTVDYADGVVTVNPPAGPAQQIRLPG